MSRHLRLAASTALALALAFPTAGLSQHATSLPTAPQASASPRLSPLTDPWIAWGHNPRMAVSNGASTALPSGYTVQLVLDTATPIAQGQMQPDCSDLRVSYVGSGTDVELDRLVEGANTAATTVTFRTQAAIGVSGADANYMLHYGNASAGSPPADLKNIFAFYEDFQSGTATGWTTKGNWSVVADGSNYVYRYTGGGANWASAYVPMTGLSDIDYVAKVRGAVSTNWIGLAFRIQDQANFLTFYESKDVGQFKLARIVADNHSIAASPAFPMGADAWYWIRLQAIGNQVRARMWQDGSAEPGTWLVDQTEGAFQTATSIGAALYNHTNAADWDEFKVRRLVATEPTVSVLVDTYALNVTTVGSGTVSKSPDQATYHLGDTVTLTATAAPGWTFAGWSGGLTGNPATVDIQGNTDVTATFTEVVVPWWSNSWGYRERLTVTNTSSTDPAGVGYAALVAVDAASLIASGRALNDLADLRVVSFDGSSNTELDRVFEHAGMSPGSVWFALPRTIAPGGQDNGYYLYYGNASAGAPPADGSKVFLFYEDWEQGEAHWTSAGGLDGSSSGTLGHTLISALDAVSGTRSQQFPVKAAGGDAFSGYIPVTPNGLYAIGLWGKSATGANLPVGIDPYDAGHVKGTENWLWTNEWTLGPQWASRSGQFTAPASAAYVKIKSEWWQEGPGTAPVFVDNIYMRKALASEPTVALGAEEGTVPGPVISNLGDSGPVQLGSPVTVSATVSTESGTVDAVTLRLESPESRDVVMNLIAGDGASGTWQAQWVPAQGGTCSYQVLAHSTVGRSTLSAVRNLQVIDTSPPQITLVGVTNPILLRATQTLTVAVTDNGVIAAVSVTVNGTTSPMTLVGGQYQYSWQAGTIGTNTWTVKATDTADNQATLNGSFVVQAPEVDVCTWLGGKVGAASWSIDDGNTGCFTELQNAGIRGTFYYNGNSTQGWFATYSAAGHEIASHSVDHPCDVPSCSPNCTPQLLWQIPFTPDEVTAYRQDELDPNIAAIEAGTGKPVVSMAWPCGCADARRMTAAQPYFLGVRGYYDYIAQLAWVQGVNEPTPAEFMNLNSDASYLQADIDLAAAQGKWAIVTSHGDCSGISYIGSLQNVLWVAPVGEVLKYIKVRNAARFSNYSRAGRAISFDAVHTLATMTRQRVDATPLLPIVFDNPVTLKVHILDTDAVLRVEVDGVVASYAIQTMDGARYVTFDAALDATRHVSVTLSKPTPVIDQVADDGPVELGNVAHVTAHITESEGPVQGATLHVTAPVAADYAMTLVDAGAGTYTASFTPDRIATWAYSVSAANDEGTTSQSTGHTFTVRDLTPPQWRNLAQAHDMVPAGQPNTLGAEALDVGGLQWAILATDESGTWQSFDGAGAGWWNRRWASRRAISVHEPAGLARTAETIDLPVSSADLAGVTNLGAQLRVADSDGHEVPSQVYGEQNVGDVLTGNLVFQADVGAGADRAYYLYYGNPAATVPAYASDLTSTTVGAVVTVRSTYLNLDLDSGGGVVSRVQLPQGTNTNLPISTSSNAYWGWHQVCSSLDGNIAGRNSLCSGGTAAASGLVMTALSDGPLVKAYEFTSQKGGATYRMTYRFFANAPYYRYDLSRTGTTAAVMNSFWYVNGDFARLGAGTGAGPGPAFDTYANGTDQVRMASLAAVDVATIDGTDNDGTQLGGGDYRFPTAAGLSLCVATGTTQAAAQDVVARCAAPLTTTLGAAESVPVALYGSPVDGGGATTWTPTSFTWQNGSIPDGRVVHWRIDYCDVTGNCRTTDETSFRIGPVNGVAVSVPPGTWISNATPCVSLPVELVRTESSPARALSVRVQLGPQLRLCDVAVPRNSIHQGSWLGGYSNTSFQVIDRGNGLYQVDQSILGDPCGVTVGGTLFTLDVTNAGADGTGTLTVTQVSARDCDNATLDFAPGAAASLVVDRTPPPAVTDLVSSGNGGAGSQAGTRKIVLGFTVPAEAATVEVYRAPFGGYPLYNRPPGTGQAPAAPTTYPLPAPWAQVVGLSGPGSDDPGTRDYWYHVVVTKDAHGNTAISARTGGALDYVLGDVHDGSVDGACVGDNRVTLSDISFLGDSYGLGVPTDATYACLDVGPTTDYALTSRPVPDGMLDFEDLVVFALNYGITVGTGPSPSPVAVAAASGVGRARPSAARAADALALEVPQLPGVGERFVVGLQYEGHGETRAVNVELAYDPTVVEPQGVSEGTLLSAQTPPHVTFSAHAGNVAVALLGGTSGIMGRGELARVTFRVVGAGDARLAIRQSAGRDGLNQATSLDGTVSAAGLERPATTALSRAMPTPFSETTTFELALSRSGPTKLAVYAVNGRRIRTLVSGDREAGVYRVAWDGRDDAGNAVAPGMYFARLATAGTTLTRTVVRVR